MDTKPSRHCSEKLLLLFVAVCLSKTMCTYAKDTTESGSLKVEPQKIKLVAGKHTTFSCTLKGNGTVLWLNPNGTDISALNSTRMNYDAAGKLHLRSLLVQDSGQYMCITSDQSHNATVTLTVFIMPDYLMVNIIILSINGGLVVVFFLCFLASCLRGGQIRKSRKMKTLKRPVEEVKVEV